MPLLRATARRANRKDEVSTLLGAEWRGEDAAPCSTPLTFAPHLPHCVIVFARSKPSRRWLVVEIGDMLCCGCERGRGQGVQ